MKDFKVINDRPSIVIVNTPAIDVNRLEGEFYKYDYLNAIDKIKKIRFLPLENLVDDIKDGPGGWDINISDYVEQGVPMLRTINIVDGLVNLDECVFIDIEKHKQLKRSRVVKNDVLLSVRGTIGKSAVYSNNFEANINAALVKITLKDNIIDPYFLVAFFNCKYGRLQTERIANGAVQLNMNLTEVKSNLIPIPSPEIQKYIGDKVRKAEELREEAKRLKKEAETFLYEMIQLKPLNDFDKDMYSFVNSNYIDSERLDSEYYKTKYITLEKLLKSKKVTSFKDIIIESKYGASVPADYTMVGIPFIRGNNLTDNEINIDDIVYLNKKLKDEVKDHHVNTGDILITRSGTVGISAVVDEKCDGFSFGSFMIKLRIDMRIWNPYYIAAFLNSFWGKWQIERLQNGAVQQNINLQEIGRIIIPIISKENQDKIEELIKNYINKKRQSKQLIQEAKQDVEDLIEGNFDMSKVKANS